jgi:hypothetical protein
MFSNSYDALALEGRIGKTGIDFTPSHQKLTVNLMGSEVLPFLHAYPVSNYD